MGQKGANNRVQRKGGGSQGEWGRAEGHKEEKEVEWCNQHKGRGGKNDITVRRLGVWTGLSRVWIWSQTHTHQCFKAVTMLQIYRSHCTWAIRRLWKQHRVSETEAHTRCLCVGLKSKWAESPEAENCCETSLKLNLETEHFEYWVTLNQLIEDVTVVSRNIMSSLVF